MLIVEYTTVTDATPVQIWNVWEDVERWNTWDHDLESSSINGPFEVGTEGYLKFKKDPLLKTLLTCVEPYKVFVQEAKLPFARVIMTHALKELDNKTYVTIKTEICGPLAIFYKMLIGSSIKKKVPLEVEAMLQRASNIKKV